MTPSVVSPDQVAILRQRLAEVQSRIAAACQRAGRSPDSVTLVAVTKQVSPDRVAAAALAGQRHFGENRVFDGIGQIQAVAALLEQAGSHPSDLVWHLIGHLQTNKARDVVRHFDRIDSVDSLRLAEKLSMEAVSLGRRLPVLLELNLLPGSDRTGFEEAALQAAAPAIARLPGLDVRGLMTIAPQTDDEQVLRRAFAQVVALRERILVDLSAAGIPTSPWTTLSMGMSGDYELAVECGATEVRLGRTLFG